MEAVTPESVIQAVKDAIRKQLSDLGVTVIGDFYPEGSFEEFFPDQPQRFESIEAIAAALRGKQGIGVIPASEYITWRRFIDVMNSALKNNTALHPQNTEIVP